MNLLKKSVDLVSLSTTHLGPKKSGTVRAVVASFAIALCWSPGSSTGLAAQSQTMYARAVTKSARPTVHLMKAY